MWNKVKRAFARIFRGYARSRKVLTYVSGFCVFFIAAITVANIITRAAFNQQIPAAYEITENGLVLVCFFAVAYAHFTNQNIRVEILLTRVSKRIAPILNLVIHVLMLVFAALLIWGSWSYFWSSWLAREIMTGAGIENVPIYPLKLVIPIMLGILCLEIIASIKNNVSQLVKRR